MVAATLTVEEGNLKGLTLSVDESKDTLTLGSNPEISELHVEDPEIDQKQALLRKTDSGFEIENLSPDHPIEINGETFRGSRLLNEGDRIKMGKQTFLYSLRKNSSLLEGAEDDFEEAYEAETPLSEKASFPQVSEDLDHPLKEEVDLPRESEDYTPELSERADEDISIFEERKDETPPPKGAEIHFDLQESIRWLLKVISGPNSGAEFHMQEGVSYLAGTDPNTCDILFHDTSVSRQHARIEVQGESVEVEDLGSKNGTFADSEAIKGKKEIAPNTVISLGTTSFVIYDREKEMQTIISPLLPSIVKVLQGEEKKEETTNAPVESASTTLQSTEEPKKEHHTAAFIVVAILVGIFSIISFGTFTLFRSEPVIIENTADVDLKIGEILKNFPGLKYSYNRTSRVLLIVGHVATATEKQQLLYALQGIHPISNIDDNGLIIDEYVWKEMNVVLGRNPNWKGISMHSPEAGRFLVTGYLPTRKQAEELSNYLTSNFPYIELLDKRVIVEEDLINSVMGASQARGFRDVKVQMNAGELSLSGNLPTGKKAEYDSVLEQLRQIQGIRVIKNFVNEQAAEQSLINLSDKYQVAGYSASGSRISVVINGRILSKGDVLDGMVITSIKPNAVFLEKDGIRYRIDFNK